VVETTTAGNGKGRRDTGRDGDCEQAIMGGFAGRFPDVAAGAGLVAPVGWFLLWKDDCRTVSGRRGGAGLVGPVGWFLAMEGRRQRCFSAFHVLLRFYPGLV